MIHVLLAVLAFGTNSASPEGTYIAGEGRRMVRIQCAEGRCVGRIARDDDHPDLVGRVVLDDLVAVGGAWKGKAVLPRKGREFPVLVSLPDSSTLRLEGKAGVFGGSRNWRRVR